MTFLSAICKNGGVYNGVFEFNLLRRRCIWRFLVQYFRIIAYMAFSCAAC